MTEEVRITCDSTGGQKGCKPEAYSMLPWAELREVARVYHMGAQKYERDNWRKGYDWSLSFDSLLRHAESFWSGEDFDSESGLPHLAHTVFHCLTLLYFSKHHQELDNRPFSEFVKDFKESEDSNWSWNGIPVTIVREYKNEEGTVLADIKFVYSECKYAGIEKSKLV